MPRRASIVDSEDSAPPVKRVRRAPRKRVEAESSLGEESVVVETSVETTPSPAPRRKAPTRRVAESIADDKSASSEAVNPPRRTSRSRFSVITITAVFLGAIGLSAALGFSDKGTIDVAAKLQEQSQIQANNAGEQAGVESQVVPVQNTPVEVPNGGLRGRGVDSAVVPVPAPTPATTTATSTETTATSTEEIQETTEDKSASEPETSVAPAATEAAETIDTAAQ